MPSLSPALTLLVLAALAGEPQGRRAAPQERPEKPQEPAAAPEDAAKSYFELADYNANGWISFSEAHASMGLDRRGFALYDEDRDGRITQAEFRKRYETIVRSGGAFDAPIGKSGLRTSGTAAPTDLAQQADKNGDTLLDRTELRSFLEELHSRLDPDVVLSKFDRDGSRKLEPSEILALAAFLDPARRSHPPPRAATLEELFGKSLPREALEGSTLLAPRIVGPVPVFRRLDLVPDGRITAEELLELQRPIQLPVRLAAVLATLDTNGDGAIDEAEFTACMGGN